MWGSFYKWVSERGNDWPKFTQLIGQSWSLCCRPNVLIPCSPRPLVYCLPWVLPCPDVALFVFVLRSYWTRSPFLYLRCLTFVLYPAYHSDKLICARTTVFYLGCLLESLGELLKNQNAQATSDQWNLSSGDRTEASPFFKSSLGDFTGQSGRGIIGLEYSWLILTL